MPKMKTKSGAKKRFKVTGTGKIKVAQAGKRHLRGATNVHETNMGHMAAMLPFAGL